MDNTTLTILGMLAAFITAFVTAFLAEPVKSYFENKNKLQNLRIALYKELILNYILVGDYVSRAEEVGELFIDLIIQHGIRTECYKHAIQNELTLFYQLPESNLISILHNSFLVLLQKPNYDDKELNKKVRSAYTISSKGFLENVAFGFYSGGLDKRLLKDLVTSNQYLELMKKGKKDFLKKKAKEILEEDSLSHRRDSNP